MSSDLCSHICDHRLDLYALGRLTDPEAAEIEEHLLLCETCRSHLSRIDRFIAALRYASAALFTDSSPPLKPVGASSTLAARLLHFAGL